MRRTLLLTLVTTGALAAAPLGRAQQQMPRPSPEMAKLDYPLGEETCHKK